ncbi:hypothetical protein [Nonomuraea sp. NEAU-A123]|uniref:hypothetical protein n=1 Tax=Nonomuraea sp. NEAU-A123 TaxID=2839649 RepID=UPI001BE3E663|nr:hypothetical protein [Nonomuraea sp. NEAU-A123]MBT2233145.1 hypothetical protein [Nonomuraea sp. NEAU-A123]
MEVSPSGPGSRRRTFAWLGAVVLLGLLAGAWLVTGIDAPAVPQEAPVAEPSDSASPNPLRVTVEPPSVPAGTQSVRVTASCENIQNGAVATSTAFFSMATLDMPLPSGGVGADVELEYALTPGTYEVNVRCEGQERFGTAELVVTGSSATPAPSGPPRTAATWITLAEAEPDAWREHPEAGLAAPGDPTLGNHVFELKVTHEVRVPDDDPDLAALRAGAAAYAPTTFVTDRLGTVETDVGSSALSIVFALPVIQVEHGSHQAVVTFTGVGYGSYYLGDGRYVGIEFSPPAEEDGVLPLSAHEIVLSATGWTVAGVHGSPPLSQDQHYLRLGGNQSIRVAFIRDGQSGSVAGYLSGDDGIGAHIEGREEVPGEEFLRTDFDFLARSGSALAWVTGFAAILVLLYSLVRALGGEWWRRRRNRLLLAGLTVAYFLVLAGGMPTAAWVAGLGLLAAGLPLLSISSARRGVSGAGKIPVVVSSVAAAAAGVTLATWGLAVLVGGFPALSLSIAAVLSAAVAIVPRWQQALPGVALVLLGAGVLLAARAVWAGIVPGVAVLTVLLALTGSVVAFGWATEVTQPLVLAHGGALRGDRVGDDRRPGLCLRSGGVDRRGMDLALGFGARCSDPRHPAVRPAVAGARDAHPPPSADRPERRSAHVGGGLPHGGCLLVLSWQLVGFLGIMLLLARASIALLLSGTTTPNALRALRSPRKSTGFSYGT